MTEQTIADMAVKITQVIKISETLTPQEIMIVILEKVPDFVVDADDIIDIFVTLARKLDIAYKDVYDIIGQLKYLVKTAVTDVLRGSWLQKIANTIYYALKALNGLLPEPYHKISLIILTAYENLIM